MSILLRQEGISTAYHVMLSHSLAQQRRIRIITFQRSYLTTDQYLIGRSRRVISARAPTSNGHAGIALTMQHQGYTSLPTLRYPPQPTEGTATPYTVPQQGINSTTHIKQSRLHSTVILQHLQWRRWIRKRAEYSLEAQPSHDCPPTPLLLRNHWMISP